MFRSILDILFVQRFQNARHCRAFTLTESFSSDITGQCPAPFLLPFFHPETFFSLLPIYAGAGVGTEFSLSTLEIEQTTTGTETKPTIWIGGDSTVASYYIDVPIKS